MSIGYPQTGFALDATEGVATTITSAHYAHDGLFNFATKKIEKKTINNVGYNGPTTVVNGKEISLISDFTLPSFGREDLPVFVAAGLSAVTSAIYALGNPIATGVNAGRTSISTLTVEQSTDNNRITLLNAKPASLSLEWKAGEIPTVKGSLQGFSNAMTSGSGYIRQQTKITSASPSGGTSMTLSLSGFAVDHTEGKIDFGLTYEQGMDASNATGHRLIGDITEYKPKMEVTILNDVNTFRFLNSLQNSTVTSFPVSLSYNLGAGNVYTWTGTGYFDGEYEFSLDGKIITNKFSINFINTSNELMRLTLS